MLITPDEEKKVQDLIKRGEGSPEATLWLCGLVQRLAAIKPTEADFPKMSALINPVSCSAIAVKFDGLMHVEKETTVFDFGRSNLLWLLKCKTKLGLCEAALCIRPYIRLVEPEDKAVLERLARHARITFEVNGALLIKNGPAEEHLVGFDGYGLRRQPFSFHPDILSKGLAVYTVGVLDQENMQAIPGGDGFFTINDSEIRLGMDNIILEAGEKIVLSVGLVIGRYTTKGINNQHLVKGPKP